MYRVALNTAIGQLKKRKKQSITTSIDQVVLRQTENYDTEFENRLKIVYEQIHQLNILEKGLILLLLEGKNMKRLRKSPD